MQVHQIAPIEPVTEADRVGAIFTLGRARQAHPDLSQQAVQARNDMVARIIALDAAWDRGELGIAEQVAVEESKQEHFHALVRLLRGHDERDDDV